MRWAVTTTRSCWRQRDSGVGGGEGRRLAPRAGRQNKKLCFAFFLPLFEENMFICFALFVVVFISFPVR